MVDMHIRMVIALAAGLHIVLLINHSINQKCIFAQNGFVVHCLHFYVQYFLKHFKTTNLYNYVCKKLKDIFFCIIEKLAMKTFKGMRLTVKNISYFGMFWFK